MAQSRIKAAWDWQAPVVTDAPALDRVKKQSAGKHNDQSRLLANAQPFDVESDVPSDDDDQFRRAIDRQRGVVNDNPQRP
jgi:hypothetical protein